MSDEAAHRGQAIRDKTLSPDQLRELDEEIERELVEMDLRALCEVAVLTRDGLASLAAKR